MCLSAIHSLIAARLKTFSGVAFLVGVAFSAVGAEKPLVTIRISTQHATTMSTYPPLDYFKKRVEERSGGSMRVEIYHSAKLYSDIQIGPAVTSGDIEVGIVDLSRYAEGIPAVDVFQLPFVFNAEGLERRATSPDSEIRALIDNAISGAYGVRVLWWTSLGQTVFSSNGMSVANPEKLAGKIVRTIGPTTNTVVSECGGSSMDIAGPDLEKALEAHQFEMAMTGISTVLGRRLYRYMDTITRTNHSSVQFVAVINSAFWGRLTASQKTIIEEAAQATDAEARRVTAEAEATAYKRLQQDYKMKVFELTAEELTLWRICSSDVLQVYLEKSGPLGQKVMRAYGRMRAASQ